MKPGQTKPPLASIIRADAGNDLRISALDPTAAILLPVTDSALAHGLARSPVQTLAFTTARRGLKSETGAAMLSRGAPWLP